MMLSESSQTPRATQRAVPFMWNVHITGQQIQTQEVGLCLPGVEGGGGDSQEQWELECPKWERGQRSASKPETGLAESKSPKPGPGSSVWGKHVGAGQESTEPLGV